MAVPRLNSASSWRRDFGLGEITCTPRPAPLPAWQGAGRLIAHVVHNIQTVSEGPSVPEIWDTSETPSSQLRAGEFATGDFCRFFVQGGFDTRLRSRQEQLTDFETSAIDAGSMA